MATAHDMSKHQLLIERRRQLDQQRQHHHRCNTTTTDQGGGVVDHTGRQMASPPPPSSARWVDLQFGAIFFTPKLTPFPQDHIQGHPTCLSVTSKDLSSEYYYGLIGHRWHESKNEQQLIR